jgi:hypothetical protein
MNAMPYGQNVITPVTQIARRVFLEDRVETNDWFSKDQLALQKAKAAHRVQEARRAVANSKPKGVYFG